MTRRCAFVRMVDDRGSDPIAYFHLPARCYHPPFTYCCWVKVPTVRARLVSTSAYYEAKKVNFETSERLEWKRVKLSSPCGLREESSSMKVNCIVCLYAHRPYERGIMQLSYASVEEFWCRRRWRDLFLQAERKIPAGLSEDLWGWDLEWFS